MSYILAALPPLLRDYAFCQTSVVINMNVNVSAVVLSREYEIAAAIASAQRSIGK